jgi:uncharacterized protein (TIGR03437 family)
VNSSSSPAPKGSVVAVYLTGLGVTSPAGVTGAIAPGNQLLTALASVTATIGGQTAPVQFAGAAPFEVEGVYQINVLVPQSITGPNPQTLTLSVNGTPLAQSGLTMYVQ